MRIFEGKKYFVLHTIITYLNFWNFCVQKTDHINTVILIYFEKNTYNMSAQLYLHMCIKYCI